MFFVCFFVYIMAMVYPAVALTEQWERWEVQNPIQLGFDSEEMKLRVSFS